MKPKALKYDVTVGDKTITFETGKLANQAGGAVTVQLGETMLFAAATMSGNARPGTNFLPLTVDYEERMYAGGRIPGSFFRREGRPSEDGILVARLTDRPLRPLFPKDMRNDIQVILYAYSVDGVNPIDILSINAASAALSISDIPWSGPVGAVRVGRVDGSFIINPTINEMDNSELDLRIAGTRDAILMVECGAKEVDEDLMLEALTLGHQSIQPLIDLQEKMASEIGKEKRAYIAQADDPEISGKIRERIEEELQSLLETDFTKSDRNSALDALKNEVLLEFSGEDEAILTIVEDAYEGALRTVIRNRTLEKGIRLDNRGYSDVRPIWCEVDITPRAHGSGLFTRGETQVLTIATLGTPRDAQELDTLEGLKSKRYMHHYNFPPFSTGETRFLRGSSRREIGHGALAERALIPVLPSNTEFPYTLRLVSEVLSSNGSSSMASVCGSTLALMDTGVPIKAPVAGVAMGLIKEGDQVAILTDILGSEDHLGDMDFKVAGTEKGITALQMDIKIKGITSQIMKQSLEQAKVARMHILGIMLETIGAPNPDLKLHAPRITVLNIPPDKIGAVIGPGGKVIRGIQDETGAKIDIDEDGTVYIAAADGNSASQAKNMIESLTETPVLGRIYTGKVVRVADFGAFVEILPNIDGMVHISQLDSVRINRVEDVAALGDEITVMVTGIDPQGKIRLSRQAVLEGWSLEEAVSKDRGTGGRSGGRSSGRDRRGQNRSSDQRNRR